MLPTLLAMTPLVQTASPFTPAGRGKEDRQPSFKRIHIEVDVKGSAGATTPAGRGAAAGGLDAILYPGRPGYCT